jgi:hypothetical protein
LVGLTSMRRASAKPLISSLLQGQTGHRIVNRANRLG